jgi:hypothetical protein
LAQNYPNLRTSIQKDVYQAIANGACRVGLALKPAGCVHRVEKKALGAAWVCDRVGRLWALLPTPPACLRIRPLQARAMGASVQTYRRATCCTPRPMQVARAGTRGTEAQGVVHLPASWEHSHAGNVVSASLQ